MTRLSSATSKRRSYLALATVLLLSFAPAAFATVGFNFGFMTNVDSVFDTVTGKLARAIGGIALIIIAGYWMFGRDRESAGGRAINWLFGAAIAFNAIPIVNGFGASTTLF